ncbi:MAG TPA: YcdB/YcdC domain-containing protein [Mobilitalea sp.]|nr:YcdB/YcdC domain-containing protein [Mobilitalea sp.]
MKKLFTLLLSGVIAATSVSTGSVAYADRIDTDVSIMPIAIEEPISNTASKETTDKALENALRAVKARITISDEYSEFDYYFNEDSSYSAGYFTLSWRNPTNSSYIQVNIDKNNNINFYNKYNYSVNSGGVAKYLSSELKTTADKFIKQIAPRLNGKLEFLEADYTGIYNGTYVYVYQRKENGVAFPDNTVEVDVDSVTGEVRSASINWLYDTSVPSNKVKLTKDEAAELIKKNMNMNLVYRMNYYRIYENGISNDVKKAFLVYQPDPSYISIDAKTGEVYLTRSEWIQSNRNEKTKEDAMSVSDKGSLSGGGLTEAEITKIKELKKLITKDRAIELVTSNKYLHIDKNMMTYSANLSKSYNKVGDVDSYVWNINLSDARPVDYEKDKDQYRAYASATVDANTGKILNFYSSLKSNYDEKKEKWNKVEIAHSKEEGQKVFEKFLKTQIKDRFNNSKLVASNDDYVAYFKSDDIPVYGGYSYQYNRFNEGIEFSYNGIYGSVDGVTGKIYSFGVNWDDDIVFESPQKAMNSEEAFKKYISNEGYDLVYEANQVNIYDPNYRSEEKYYDYSEAYSVEYEIRLVYRPDVYPSYISPFTGEQINYDGTAYTKTQPYKYSDIANTPENREILLLSDMNIGFEGELFNPSKAITTEELALLMKQIGYGYPTSETEAKTSDKLITREEIAYNFIDKLGLTKMAELTGIYTTGYSDEKDIDNKNIGAVALAKGLGLIEAKADNKFLPDDNVTRAEAVRLIINFIKVQRERNY